jgi:hypothetical protein
LHLLSSSEVSICYVLLIIVDCDAEEALERSGMSYCIVRPGGMERPTDDYKKTHNLVLKPRDSTFGGQVRHALQQHEESQHPALCCVPASAGMHSAWQSSVVCRFVLTPHESLRSVLVFCNESPPQVSRLQVAELVTATLINPDLATNKCLELVAETTAPAVSLEQLLEAMPQEITKVSSL